MDFLVEFLRSSIEFVIMGGVALLGIFLGVKLRKKKNNSEKE
ncbi:MAG: LPXTG cell wall anchor domain-containing protein [Lachnospiraceae bacterium]|nr:LPXTG cell wall anchor domain-containing protein [Lachnospiraceae bacterium]